MLPLLSSFLLLELQCRVERAAYYAATHSLIVLRPPHVVRIHTIQDPRSTNSGYSGFPRSGESSPLKDKKRLGPNS